jgi:TRAP-type transport system small permease protein
MKPDRIDTVLGVLCAVPCLVMVALTFADVFARYLFSAPVRGSLEVIEFCMALTIFTALPLVTRHKGHVTVGLFAGGTGALQRWRHMFCDLLSLVALALLAWRLWSYAAESAAGGTRTMVLRLPEAPLVQAMSLLCVASAIAVGTHLVTRVRRAVP